MDAPLTKWYCDVCGNPIDDVNEGYVIWKTEKGLKLHSFKIIHQDKCDLDNHLASAKLEDFLGEQGLAYLLSKLSIGPIKKLDNKMPHCYASDMDEFVDFVRRVQTPFYEEARRLFGNHDVLEYYSDSNEALPYLPDQLQKIITEYGNR